MEVLYSTDNGSGGLNAMGGGGEGNDNIYVDGLPAEIDNSSIQQIFSVYGTITSIKAMPGKRPGQKGAALIRWSTADEAEWLVTNVNGQVPVGLEEAVVIRFANQERRDKGGGKGDKGGGKSYSKSYDGGKGYKGYSDGMYDTAPRSSPYDQSFQFQGGKGDAGSGPRGAGQGVSDADINDVVQGFMRSGQMPGGVKHAELCLYVSGLPRNTTELDMYKIFSPFGALSQRGVTVMQMQDGSATGVGFVDFQDPQACQMAVATLNGSTLPDGCVLSVKPKAPKRQ